MKVYSVVRFHESLQGETNRDRLEFMGEAWLFDSLEKAKAAVEAEVEQAMEEAIELEDELEEPNMTWLQMENWHGDHQLDPWNQANGRLTDWDPGWWCIRELEVN